MQKRLPETGRSAHCGGIVTQSHHATAPSNVRPWDPLLPHLARNAAALPLDVAQAGAPSRSWNVRLSQTTSGPADRSSIETQIGSARGAFERLNKPTSKTSQPIAAICRRTASKVLPMTIFALRCPALEGCGDGITNKLGTDWVARDPARRIGHFPTAEVGPQLKPQNPRGPFLRA